MNPTMILTAASETHAAKTKPATTPISAPGARNRSVRASHVFR
jgi:hypothetical protein